MKVSIYIYQNYRRYLNVIGILHLKLYALYIKTYNKILNETLP